MHIVHPKSVVYHIIQIVMLIASLLEFFISFAKLLWQTHAPSHSRQCARTDGDQDFSVNAGGWCLSDLLMCIALLIAVLHHW